MREKNICDAAIIIGMPGSFKGTVCRAIHDSAENGNGPIHIEMSHVLKLRRRWDRDFDDLANSFMAEGRLVPDPHIMGVLNDYLNHLSHERLWVFDGVPRNHTQAGRLDHFLRKRNYDRQIVFHLKATEDQARENIIARAKKEGREDDQKIDVINRRLEIFKGEIDPMVDFYRARKVEIVEISCADGSAVIIEKIKQVLEIN